MRENGPRVAAPGDDANCKTRSRRLASIAFDSGNETGRRTSNGSFGCSRSRLSANLELCTFGQPGIAGAPAIDLSKSRLARAAAGIARNDSPSEVCPVRSQGEFTMKDVIVRQLRQGP